MVSLKSKQIGTKQLELRARLWPEITESELWTRQRSKGFATLPRTMPLILAIMDDMTKSKPVSSTYLELFCRGFDDCMINLNKPKEMAFHAGFTGERAERTWKDRLRSLATLGFIKLQGGASGEMSHALILNPYKVIKQKYERGSSGITLDKYNALQARAIEIGANDLDNPISVIPIERNKKQSGK